MKTKDVIGKRIVSVDHVRWFNTHLNQIENDVERITLDDGSVLFPFAYETDDCPAATIHHLKTGEVKK